MNEILVRGVVFLGVAFLLYWLWKRIFRGAGKTIVAISWILLILAASISFQVLQILFLVSLIAVAILEGWRMLALPKYSKANSAFETNQILRGLTPEEAAYFIGLEKQDVFVVAVLNLLDKGMLKFQRTNSNNEVMIADDYLSSNPAMSPAERASARDKTAKKDRQIIHPYEDVILELFTSSPKSDLADIDSEIWYQYLDNQLNKLAGVYEFSKTADYAGKVVEKMTSPDSPYSAGRRNSSAWIAIRLIEGGRRPVKEHRPEWLSPDDDFQSVVRELRDQVKINL